MFCIAVLQWYVLCLPVGIHYQWRASCHAEINHRIPTSRNGKPVISKKATVVAAIHPNQQHAKPGRPSTQRAAAETSQDLVGVDRAALPHPREAVSPEDEVKATASVAEQPRKAGRRDAGMGMRSGYKE